MVTFLCLQWYLHPISSSLFLKAERFALNTYLLVDNRIQTSQAVLTERVAAVEFPRKPLYQVVGTVADDAVKLSTVSRGLGCCDLVVLGWSL